MTTIGSWIMTDIPPPLNALAAAARQQHHPLSTLPFAAASSAPRRSAQPPIDDGIEEDDGEIICICGMRHDDGFSVQCETCNNWQHMICYYPTEADRPGEHQKHYCFDCQPRWLDADQAKERQKKQIQRQALDSRRPGPKHRKKQKESPSAVNGSLLQGRERKSASPRDQPPPAKRPKTGHRSSAAASHAPTSRKRNARSPSPDPSRPIIPWYSEEFYRLYSQVSSHVETETNLMNNIAVTNSLSEWLKNPAVVEKDTNGLAQNDIFLRWDGSFEDMPGRPEVAVHWEADPNFTDQAEPPKWPCLTVEQDISKRTFIGELRGHIGYKEEYMNDPDSRWSSLRHAEPFVFFHPQLPIYIDARQEGTMFRYVRRSCRPNTEIQTIITDGTNYHFCFMATKDLQSGEEITVAWQTDDTIKAMYAERGIVHGDVPADIKYAIAMWVSNVLANCGPCACNGEGCLMARFDRRGQPQPVEPTETAPAPIKVPKARRKKTSNNLSPIDLNRNSHSRSGSEARKVEVEDDMTDTRSVSGSFRASASRDITPGTHYSAVIPEMSEREKKKLMREEEMFRRQEEESGRQKKKRHSGATPLLPQSSTLSSSKQQSSEPSSSRRGTISKRPSKPSRSGKQSESTRPVYVDSSVQCDMDNDDPPGPPMPTPPKKKQYLSVTQRLLRRCASNNLKRKAESETPEDAPTTNGVHPDEDMDIDNADQSPTSVGAASRATPLSPVSVKHADVNMTEAAPVHPASLSPAFGPVDANMQEMDDEHTQATPPPNGHAASSYSSASPSTSKSGLPSHPPMDPPPPPWPQKDVPSMGEVLPASPEFKDTRLEMHLTMPPPLNSATSPTLLSQSPATMTPGLSNIPLFSPSVSAAVNPSPARKKLSLSDYTKRNKVHQPRDISPAASLTDSVSAKDKESILNGVAVTDSPASEQAIDAAVPAGSQESVVPPA
ncbi:hypothetical protein E4T42_05082 [Aureobasidium subglaciale]|nr:hypothetical protein E4T42_05082 [Aureobasidium subglaciale]